MVVLYLVHSYKIMFWKEATFILRFSFSESKMYVVTFRAATAVLFFLVLEKRCAPAGLASGWTDGWWVGTIGAAVKSVLSNCHNILKEFQRRNVNMAIV